MNPEQPPHQPENAPGSADASLGMAPEISRRVASILDAVEREAARLRAEAREEALRYLEESRRRADGLVAERQRRIAALSEELVAKSEAVVARLDDAAPVRQGFENLVRALGDAAERLSHERATSEEEFAPPPFPGSGTMPAPPPAEPRSHDPVYSPPPEPVYSPPPPPPPAQAYQPPPAPLEYSPPPPPPQPEPQPEMNYAPPTEQRHAQPEQQPPPPAFEPPPVANQTPPIGEPDDGSGGYDAYRDFSTQPHPARAPSVPEWQPEPQAEQVPVATAPGWRELDDAKMVAIQLAATGATRAGVRDHLQRGLGIPDATTILDEVFGVGSRDDTRVPWTTGPR